MTFADFDLLPLERTWDGVCGLTLEQVTPTEVRARVADATRLAGPEGRVPLGLFTSIAESMASHGTAAGVLAEGRIAMGMSNNTQALASVEKGTIAAVARRRAHTDTEWLWDVEMRLEGGELCALSEVCIAVRPPPRA